MLDNFAYISSKETSLETICFIVCDFCERTFFGNVKQILKNKLKSMFKYTYQFQIDMILIRIFSWGVFCSIRHCIIFFFKYEKTKMDFLSLKT